ncbi:peptide-methionine (R)-S-oxide reductase MsrB [Patescibacteria group bacterium]
MKKDYKNKLTPEQYNICFLGRTEPPGSGKYNKHFEPGTYNCVACSTPLFSSETKFDSGTGWPSFFNVLNSKNIKKVKDESHGMIRTEVCCNNCNAHLGHVFQDGPKQTGQRYCINSLSLKFSSSK